MRHELLHELHACRDAVEFAEQFETLDEAWQKCERGDWMLWLAAKFGMDRKLVVKIACECARLALPHAGKNHGVVLAAIDAAEGWVRGEVDITAVRSAAATAAYAATAADAAAYAATAAYAAAYAAYAAYAAAYAADAAAYAAYAASAAAYAADAAADAAATAAADAARKNIQRECAVIVRKHLPRVPQKSEAK